jgi:hypothetical protein
MRTAVICIDELGLAEGADVQIQLSKRAGKGVPVHSQRAGGFGLVPIEIPKYGEDKPLPEFSDSFRKDHTCLTHLMHHSIKLSAGRIL